MILLRRLLALVAVTVALMLGAGAAALAQPTQTPTPITPDPGTSTSYGFDQTCNDIHDGLSQIPVIGGAAGDFSSAVCKAGNAASHPGSAAEATKSKLWDSAFGKVTETLLDGLGDALSLSMLWVRLPNDQLLSSAGPDADPEHTLWGRVDSYTRQLQTWVLAFSIVISALRIGIARAQAAAEHAEEAFKMLARSTMTTWVAGTAILAGARMTDRLSAWIIDDATDGNARGAAELLVNTHRFGVYGPGFIFLVTIVGILGALAMTVLTIIRQALLVVAVGVYPLTAAASGTTGGRQAYQKLGAWIIAFLLFKPVAALVYMIAFVTADQTNSEASQGEASSFDSAHRALIGVVLLCSVAFVLPALVRLVVPALSVIGSGGSGAGAAGIAGGAAVTLFTAGKALLARGAASGGAGSAGYVSVRSPTPPTPPPPGRPETGGAPKSLPPGPSSGPNGSGSARKLPAGAQGTGNVIRKAGRAGAASYSTGQTVDRASHDVAGNRALPAAPSRSDGPDLGRHRIDR